MSMLSQIRRSAGLSLLLLPGCALPLVWVEASEEFTLPSAPIRRVQCNTTNGVIHVQGLQDTAAPVRVVVRKRAGGVDEADARLALAAIEVIRDNAADLLRLTWKWTTQNDGWQASVGFAVTLPQDRPAELETSNGAVKVADLAANTSVKTSNGGVELIRCTGDWQAATSNGSIAASGDPRSLALATSNGNVSAEIATQGPVQGRIKTSNGGIEFKTAAKTSVRVRGETSNGAATAGAAFKIHESGKHHVDASRNGGEGVVTLDTSNGSIRIE